MGDGSYLPCVVNIILAPLHRSNAFDLLAVLTEFTFLYQFLFLHCLGSKTPTSGICIALHNAALDFCDNTMVASGKVDSRHECDGQCNSLSFGSHEDNLLMNGNVGFIAKKSRNHELGSVTDGVDGTVFHHNTFVTDQQRFQWPNGAAQVRLWAIASALFV